MAMIDRPDSIGRSDAVDAHRGVVLNGIYDVVALEGLAQAAILKGDGCEDQFREAQRSGQKQYL
jgi:hypothetical protein